ncbi:transposase [Comamonas testosteroni]|nr:transposase [Comamonas testosteroni]
MSQSPQSKPRYRTTNRKQYNAALKARGSLTIWLNRGMSWFAAASGKRGRSPQFSDAAIQFCLTMALLHKPCLKRATPNPSRGYTTAAV